MRRVGVCIGVSGIINNMLVPSQVLRPKTLRRGDSFFGVSESEESLLVIGFKSQPAQPSGQWLHSSQAHTSTSAICVCLFVLVVMLVLVSAMVLPIVIVWLIVTM